jgi:HD-like signal output (HDOD) protein
MRMPVMNGAELLAQVMKFFPQTVRLILSGHADQELILGCVGAAHQFLSKPCQPEALKTAVRRALEVGNSFQHHKLKQLVSQLDRLPSIPSLYVEIVKRLQDPEVPVREIGEMIQKDMGMTAQILKLANSAFFGLPHEISSPAEAVTYIGLDTIKSLVLAVQTFSQFENKNLGGEFSLQELWGHSQETAAAARLIARLEKADTKLRDAAFTAGFLHDTGKLVLASNFPQEYDQVLKRKSDGAAGVLAAEEQTFGANHAQVGGYLLGLWALPVPVAEAVAFHHCPGKSLNKTFTPLTAVSAANLLVRASADINPAAMQQETNYLAELGLQDHWAGWSEAWRGTK